ncbi:hypothetical protein D1872_307540 [compost metagenome]
MKSLAGRKIIYVGDYDGADTPIELSKVSEVVWIAPETRYRYAINHDWVEHDDSEFKGVFIRAWNLDEMFEGLKRVTRFYNLRIDLHENNVYEDDEEYEDDYYDDYYEDDDEEY